ncbi:transposase [Lactobacillus hilgardii]
MKNYPSNITRQQFELIRPALENFRKRTKPRKYDLYEVFCAVLYVLKTGCQWRSVYNYYKIWSTKAEPTADSLLEQVLKKLSLLGELTKDVQL